MKNQAVLPGAGSAAGIPTAREILLGEGVVTEERERLFFTSVRLKNRTYKTTYPHRLDEVNELVVPLLPAVRPLRIMDVAVSTGVSTWEWVQRLEQLGIEHRMTAGDSTVRGFLLSLGRSSHLLVDDSGYPLQLELDGRALPTPAGKRIMLRYGHRILLLKLILAFGFDWFRRACGGEVPGSVRRAGILCRPVSFVTPRLMECSNIDVVQDDIFLPSGARRFYHVVRAANILNRYYFEEPRLIAGIAELRDRLADGGLLIVCRTEEDGKNNGTIYCLNEERRFVVAARVGSGSEVEDLVVGLPVRSDGGSK